MNDIRININSLSVLEELDVHDGKLGEVKCDYANQDVYIPIELDSPEKRKIKVVMKFNCVKMFSMEILEPWGKGIYISEIRYDCFKHIDNDISFEVIILLNYGDALKIVSEEIELY